MFFIWVRIAVRMVQRTTAQKGSTFLNVLGRCAPVPEQYVTWAKQRLQVNNLAVPTILPHWRKRRKFTAISPFS
jgi:hypothetical protein